MDISERLSFFAALYKVNENSDLGMWLLYLTILFLSILVFKLGFAQKLPFVTIRYYLSFSCFWLFIFNVSRHLPSNCRGASCGIPYFDYL